MRFADLVSSTLDGSEPCSLALSRPTPPEVFQLVATSATLPSACDVFQVDERSAPAGSEERNATLIERDLAPWLGDARFHPMPVESMDADVYEGLLTAICGRPPVLDVVHLGLGEDGHTASLLPGDPVLERSDPFVAHSGPSGGYDRMTLTYPALDRARLVVFVAVGPAKAEAVERVIAGDRSLPAARLGASNVVFLLDAAAASRL